jgi:hypothetical protein
MDPRWLAVLAGHPDASPFHLPTWAQLVADCYGFRPFALLIHVAGRPLTGIPMIEMRDLPWRRRWVALPFTDAVPLLGGVGTESSLTSALEIERMDRGLSGIEIRCALPGTSVAHPQAIGWRHTLDLTRPAAELRSRLARTHRQSLRKAEAEGVQIVRQKPAVALEEFWRLHVATRRRLGVPVQPRRFFDLLLERTLAPGSGFILCAVKDGETIASGVFLMSSQIVAFKYAASDARHWTSRANHLLAWSAVEWACANGYRTFDWGRTAADDEGLRRYKESFGATPEGLVYTRLGATPLSPNTHWPFGNLMRAAIRRGPPSLCRVAGELLYRYAS